MPKLPKTAEQPKKAKTKKVKIDDPVTPGRCEAIPIPNQKY
jgi:hypothetical protein